jgi:hypothetical protein
MIISMIFDDDHVVCWNLDSTGALVLHGASWCFMMLHTLSQPSFHHFGAADVPRSLARLALFTVVEQEVAVSSVQESEYFHHLAS